MDKRQKNAAKALEARHGKAKLLARGSRTEKRVSSNDWPAIGKRLLGADAAGSMLKSAAEDFAGFFLKDVQGRKPRIIKSRLSSLEKLTTRLKEKLQRLEDDELRELSLQTPKALTIMETLNNIISELNCLENWLADSVEGIATLQGGPDARNLRQLVRSAVAVYKQFPTKGRDTKTKRNAFLHELLPYVDGEIRVATIDETIDWFDEASKNSKKQKV